MKHLAFWRFLIDWTSGATIPFNEYSYITKLWHQNVFCFHIPCPWRPNWIIPSLRYTNTNLQFFFCIATCLLMTSVLDVHMRHNVTCVGHHPIKTSNLPVTNNCLCSSLWSRYVLSGSSDKMSVLIRRKAIKTCSRHINASTFFHVFAPVSHAVCLLVLGHSRRQGKEAQPVGGGEPEPVLLLQPGVPERQLVAAPLQTGPRQRPLPRLQRLQQGLQASHAPQGGTTSAAVWNALDTFYIIRVSYLLSSGPIMSMRLLTQHIHGKKSFHSLIHEPTDNALYCTCSSSGSTISCVVSLCASHDLFGLSEWCSASLTDVSEWVQSQQHVRRCDFMLGLHSFVGDYLV